MFITLILSSPNLNLAFCLYLYQHHVHSGSYSDFAAFLVVASAALSEDCLMSLCSFELEFGVQYNCWCRIILF